MGFLLGLSLRDRQLVQGLLLLFLCSISAERPSGGGGGAVAGAGAYYSKPHNCYTLDCPSYRVVHYQSDLEIRSYEAATWMSTSPISSISYKVASDLGFMSLFAYIGGKNKQGAKIDMTAPVLVDVRPSQGPFCNSTFVVRFYLPNKYQAPTSSTPAPASDEVRPVRWPAKRYAAVRRFGGFMDDSNIAVHAAALRESLAGTPWGPAALGAWGYTVSGYNSPFEFADRVNEVMMLFDM